MEENNLTNQSFQNEQTVNQQFNNQSNQTPLPNASAVLVLGIISIALCWCAGIVGVICGIIALVLSGKANTIYNSNPNAYTLSSYKNMKAGKVCAIIGTILSSLYFVYYIIIIIVAGTALSMAPWASFR